MWLLTFPGHGPAKWRPENSRALPGSGACVRADFGCKMGKKKNLIPWSRSDGKDEEDARVDKRDGNFRQQGEGGLE